MRLHLFSTDASVFRVAELLPASDQVVALAVPANRLHTDKVIALRLGSHLPVHVHAQGRHLPPTLPAADAAILWLYSQIIDVTDLRRYPSGMLNMHGGKIPEYRGASVLRWAIEEGEREIGVTWHAVIEEVDAGGIYAESTIPVAERETVSDVRLRMLAEGVRLFPEAWQRFRSGADPIRIPDLSTGRVWPSWRPPLPC